MLPISVVVGDCATARRRSLAHRHPLHCDNRRSFAHDRCPPVALGSRERLVPALQRQGLTRKAYAHKHLRDNLLEF